MKQTDDVLPPSPACPQIDLPYPAWWEGPLPDYGLPLALPEQDEFKCLNLNLTIPREAVDKPCASKLPVLVFIHGGGFIGGSQSVQVGGREVYDAYNLVSTSLNLQKGLIVVSINYRLGPLGFLASSHLEAFNKKHGEPVGNYGLHDQRQALEWVSKYIEGFGGNPDNVTIQGTSAGGVSCHIQSIFPQRKFQRAICASGTIPSLAAQPLEEHNIFFDNLCQQAGGIPQGEDAVAFLQSVSPERLVSTAPRLAYCPVVDGHWIPSQDLPSILSTVRDAPDIIIGSCANEVC